MSGLDWRGSTAALPGRLPSRARKREWLLVAALVLVPIPLLVLSGIGVPLPGAIERGIASILPGGSGTDRPSAPERPAVVRQAPATPSATPARTKKKQVTAVHTTASHRRETPVVTQTPPPGHVPVTPHVPSTPYVPATPGPTGRGDPPRTGSGPTQQPSSPGATTPQPPTVSVDGDGGSTSVTVDGGATGVTVGGSVSSGSASVGVEAPGGTTAGATVSTSAGDASVTVTTPGGSGATASASGSGAEVSVPGVGSISVPASGSPPTIGTHLP